jgi:hypothetical protein
VLYGQLGRTSQLEKFVSRKTIEFVLVAVFLSSAACDKSPLEVTGTSTNSLTPAYTTVTAKSLSFNENFNRISTTPALLEATGIAPSYATGAALFAGSDDSDRGYLRTIAANYNTTSFRADVTVTIPGGYAGDGIAFFGFGIGQPNCDFFFCEADTGPVIFARILPSDFNGPKVEITGANENTLSTTFGEGGTGTHRVRIVWNSDTREITFSIMSNYVNGEEFVPTAVMGPFVLGSEFDVTNSHIFFGGAGMGSFDDMNVKVTK